MQISQFTGDRLQSDSLVKSTLKKFETKGCKFTGDRLESDTFTNFLLIIFYFLTEKIDRKIKINAAISDRKFIR